MVMSELIHASKTKSAPALDGIPYSILKKLPPLALDWVLKFFNKILTSGD